MSRNDNAVRDCKCDQFYQVKVCTERDDDCAVSLQKKVVVYICDQLLLLLAIKMRILLTDLGNNRIDDIIDVYTR